MVTFRRPCADGIRRCAVDPESDGGSNLVLAATSEQGLGDALAGSPATQELGQGGSAQPVGRDRSEERECGLTLTQADVRHLLEKAYVPAGGGPIVLLRFIVSEKKGELERLGEADELKLLPAETARGRGGGDLEGDQSARGGGPALGGRATSAAGGEKEPLQFESAPEEWPPTG